jgi:hypothetical protein
MSWVRTLPSRFGAQLALALALYILLVPRLHEGLRLPEVAYGQPVLMWQALTYPPAALLLAVMLAPLLFGWRRLRWESIDPRGHARILVVVAVAVLAWPLSTYGFNAYYGYWHLLDRLVLIALAGLTWSHPAFAMPFLAAWLVIFFQVFHPLPDPGWHWPDKRLPVDVLTLFVVFLYIHILVPTKRHLLGFLVLGVTGATYAQAALNKVLTGPEAWTWLVGNELTNIFVSAHVNGGWLRDLGETGIATWGARIAVLTPLMALFTLVVEGGGFLLLFHRRLAQAVIAGFVLLHTGILTLTGIFFWKWIVFDLALLWYVTKTPDASPTSPESNVTAGVGGAGSSLFSIRNGILAAAIALAAPVLFNTVPFAWLDSRYVNHFEIWGIAADGSRHRLDPRFFAPYDVVFQQSRFYYLVDGPVLVGTYGTTDRWEVAESLRRSTSGDVREVRAQHGRNFFDERAAARFESFVRRYAEGSRRRPRPLGAVAAPFHFQTTEHRDTYAHDVELVEVEVTFVEHFFDGATLHEVDAEQVLRVRLRAPETGEP